MSRQRAAIDAEAGASLGCARLRSLVSPMKKLLLTLTLGIVLSASAAEKDGWISLFDGKSLAGWKANESPDTFKVAVSYTHLTLPTKA